MADIIIYGATPAGAQARAAHEAAGDRVLGFVDHDGSRVGTTFDGLTVVPSAALLDVAFDRVHIASADAAATLTFLLKLGVPLAKLEPASAAGQEPPDSRPTAIIYGAKLEALRTLAYVERDYRVLCFCDGDAAMHGKRLAGRFVIAPADLCVLKCDRVFLGVPGTYAALHDLLWHWNVPLEKMDVVPESVLCPQSAAASAGAQVRYIIFGAGASAEQLFKRLSQTADVVAFVDNSTAKHGTTFCGRTVYPPTSLETLVYDRIAIGSMFAAEIYQQLSALGIDSRSIEIPDPAAPVRAPAQASSRSSGRRGWWAFWRRSPAW